MQLYCYRIHLHSGTVTGELNLGDDENPQMIQTKEDYIRFLFTRRIDCREVNAEYVYDHEYQDGEYIGGVFGKPRLETLNDGPEGDWQTRESPSWYPYSLVVDPTEHENGQIIYVEGDSNKTQKRFVDSISRYVNQRGDCPWIMTISLLNDREQLDEVLRDNRNQIVSIVVNFPPVNMPSDLGSDVNAVRQKIAGANARINLEARAASESNILTDHEAVQDTLELANQTGAVTKVYAEGDETTGGHEKEVYNSLNMTRARKVRLVIETGVENISGRLEEIINRLRS